MSGKSVLSVCDFEQMTKEEKLSFIRWLRFEADFFEKSFLGCDGKVSDLYSSEWQVKDAVKWDAFIDQEADMDRDVRLSANALHGLIAEVMKGDSRREVGYALWSDKGRSAIRMALRDLTEKQKLDVVNRLGTGIGLGMSFSEMAAARGVTANAVRESFQGAIRSIKYSDRLRDVAPWYDERKSKGK